MKRRISSLPRFLECPSSEAPTEREYNPPSDAADAGTAAHKALQSVVAGGYPDIIGIASEYGVDADEVEAMYSYGLRAWHEIGKYFPNARSEEPLEGDGIRGTSDVFHNDGETMCVLDWKTNRVKRGYMDQVAGYAAAAVDQYGMPASGVVTVIVVWLRFGEFEVKNLAQDDIERFHHRIKSAELRIGKDYAPGSACGFCRRQLECRARGDFLRSSATSIASFDGGQIVSREVLGSLYERSKMLGKALDRYKDALRLALTEGPIDLGDGDMLTLEEGKREKLDAQAAWPVLVGNGFTDSDLAKCVSLSKTAALKVIGSKASRGNKGKEQGRLIEALREAGAVIQTPTESIRVAKGGAQ